MAFDLTALSTYTDETSMDLIAKAVLETDLMSYYYQRQASKNGPMSRRPKTILVKPENVCGSKPGISSFRGSNR